MSSDSSFQDRVTHVPYHLVAAPHVVSPCRVDCWWEEVKRKCPTGNWDTLPREIVVVAWACPLLLVRTYECMYVCIYLCVCWFYAHSFVACLSCTTHTRRTHIHSTGQINPGCGCNSELVEQVVEDLKARQAGRGDPGQIQRQEATLESIRELHRKLDLIMDHLQIERE